MAIQRLLQNSPVTADTSALVTAYAESLKLLGLTDRDDPLTEIVARKIIEIGTTGLRDPDRIATLTLSELGPAP